MEKKEKDKSAEEILSEITGETGIYLTHGMIRGRDALAAMELYANQRLKENQREDNGSGDKEDIMSIITSTLYNISTYEGKRMMDTDKCDEVAEFIYQDLKKYFQPPSYNEPGI